MIKKYWGKGYATEAAIACSEYAFNELKINRVISLISNVNTAAKKVAPKLGMKFEKTLTNSVMI